VTESPSRLLVVDDEFASRTALSRRLERRGYSVDAVEDAGEALDKLLRDRYDLVLLDQMMPGMSGLDLLRLLRATYSPAELPVIMVTAVDNNERIVEALEEGANDYVVKPVEMPDVTARIQAQLLRSKTLRKPPQAAAPACGTDAPWDWDPVTGTAHFSARWKEIVGHAEDEIGDHLQEWLDRIHPSDLVRVRRQLNAHLEGSTPEFRCEHRLRHKNGQYRWVLCRGVALHGEDGKLLRLAGSIADIDDIKGADPLTGLSNRPQMLDRLAARLDRQGATPADPVTVLLVDLDGLSLVNQSAGHEAGDKVLMEVAARLREVVAHPPFPPGSSLARVGGDEFAILSDCPGGACDVGRLAEAVLKAMERPFAAGENVLHVAASVGVVIAAPRHTPDQLLRDADLAMCQARQAGHHRWQLYEPSLRDRAHTAVIVARDLRHAVDRRELVAVYQPKVALRSGRIAGFEALLRWRHPELGLVHPRDFIPAAEESGAIVRAGEWILREACRQLRAWQQEFRADPPLVMGVNLSARQLNDPGLSAMVRRALEESGIAPHCLHLELTESALIAERETARSVLEEIRRMGVGFELDDFGTGYASLSYLNLLRFDALKIDRSFVGRLETDAECRAITRAVLALARDLGMEVVAEGVETGPQLEILREMDCRYGQGYYFSMPVEAGAARDLLRAQAAREAPSAA
jgi:diguanylate cyclase (GGDEF)-like protein/PAS domain S-box-containing protein